MGMVNLCYDRPLQLAIMGALWRRRELTLEQLVQAVGITHRLVARSTVATSLYRLIDQEWVSRVGHGRYQAIVTRDELVAVISAAVMEA